MTRRILLALLALLAVSLLFNAWFGWALYNAREWWKR